MLMHNDLKNAPAGQKKLSKKTLQKNKVLKQISDQIKKVHQYIIDALFLFNDDNQ